MGTTTMGCFHQSVVSLGIILVVWSLSLSHHACASGAQLTEGTGGQKVGLTLPRGNSGSGNVMAVSLWLLAQKISGEGSISQV